MRRHGEEVLGKEQGDPVRVLSPRRTGECQLLFQREVESGVGGWEWEWCWSACVVLTALATEERIFFFFGGGGSGKWGKKKKKQLFGVSVIQQSGGDGLSK